MSSQPSPTEIVSMGPRSLGTRDNDRHEGPRMDRRPGRWVLTQHGPLGFGRTLGASSHHGVDPFERVQRIDGRHPNEIRHDDLPTERRDRFIRGVSGWIDRE